MIVIFFLISLIMPINGWLSLALSILFCGIIGLLVNSLLLLEKKEIKAIADKIKLKIKRS